VEVLERVSGLVLTPPFFSENRIKNILIYRMISSIL